MRRVGEEHRPGSVDDEVVRRVEAVVGEVAHAAVDGCELEAGRGFAEGQVDADRELREVDAAVLGDEDRPVGRERGAVGAAAGVGDVFASGAVGRDPDQ